MQTMQNESQIDIPGEYRDFQSQAIEDQILNRLAVAKHLNIPYSERGSINTTTTNLTQGIKGWALAALIGGTVLGGAGGALGLLSMLTSDHPAVITPTPQDHDIQVKIEVIPPPE